MFVQKLSLDRRTFLRAAGVTLALPMLDAMTPAFAATPKRVPRIGFLYIPNGVNPNTWSPTGRDKQFEFSSVMASLQPFKDKVTIFTNIAHHCADRQNDGAGDHSRATGAFLSGCHAKRTQGDDMYLGITADQIAAKSALGKDSLLPSLELSLEDRNIAPLCDEGYTCAYSNTLSWSSPTTPLPTENDPRFVFERLFGEEGNTRERAIRLQEDLSILDSVTGALAQLKMRLGTNDRRKMDQYLTSVREVEQRLERIEAKNAQSATGAMAMGKPLGVPEKFEDHIRLMFDLQVLAFQGDITRITTLMFAREMAVRSYPQVGVPDSHHSVSHHDNNPAKLAKLKKIDTYHVEQFAYFLGKLRNVQDGENNLLENSMILYGGALANGNLHNHTNLPMILAGGGAGQLEGGRHMVFKNDMPMSNLLRSILRKAGVETESLGDSTGYLTEL
jgi:Protein of unknown function (DUF1552)